MGVDVYLRWKDQTEEEANADGWTRGVGASQVLFEECWPPETVERSRKIAAGLPVEPLNPVTITFDEVTGEGPEPNGDRAAREREDVEPEPEIPELIIGDDEDDDFDGDYKPFRAALLRKREKPARRHVWAFAKLEMNERGVTDGERIHQRFLEEWLPYKRFIELAEQKERETGQPVEVWVSY